MHPLLYACKLLCATISLVAASMVRYVATTRIVRVLNKFCTRSESIIKTFLTLVEVIEVTNLFLYMELENFYF